MLSPMWNYLLLYIYIYIYMQNARLSCWYLVRYWRAGNTHFFLIK
ncbi:MAG: hypothetical protein N7Q72_00390 [Spiroplasma sp. Tabriz.8]|nr:hypothetical protein [Spiroplasma sp. Tabriz.8]